MYEAQWHLHKTLRPLKGESQRLERCSPHINGRYLWAGLLCVTFSFLL